MTGHRLRILALSAFALAALAVPATSATRFDGTWSLTAVTTKGHCGVIPVAMAITRGRISATGGSFALYPIRLSGRVGRSGGTSLKAITGPRIAWGKGRFGYLQGKGTWHGTGPSGLCSGVWTATRS